MDRRGKKNLKKFLPVRVALVKIEQHAGVAELADAYGSGPYELRLMKVQVLSPAPLNVKASAMGPFSYPGN